MRAGRAGRHATLLDRNGLPPPLGVYKSPTGYCEYREYLTGRVPF